LEREVDIVTIPSYDDRKSSRRRFLQSAGVFKCHYVPDRKEKLSPDDIDDVTAYYAGVNAPEMHDLAVNYATRGDNR
jgi:hypothetical protein